MGDEAEQKEYFISFGSVASGIRVKKSLICENFTLFSPFSKHNPLPGNSVQSLVVRVNAGNADMAYVKANQEKNKITTYLAGIFQVPFFFTDHSIDYEVYTANPLPDWESLKLPPTKSICRGWPRSYGIIFRKDNTVLVNEVPNFSQYNKQCEEIFYMWRSATDSFNELGWRFLNYFRIIEKITGKQRGAESKSKAMYKALPQDVKDLMTENDFVTIAKKWVNPSAHGNMPNSIVPITPHGNYDEDPEVARLFMIVRVLIKKYLEN